MSLTRSSHSCLQSLLMCHMFLGFNQHSVSLTCSSHSYFFGVSSCPPDKAFWWTLSPVINFQFSNLQFMTFREETLRSLIARWVIQSLLFDTNEVRPSPSLSAPQKLWSQPTEWPFRNSAVWSPLFWSKRSP